MEECIYVPYTYDGKKWVRLYYEDEVEQIKKQRIVNGFCEKKFVVGMNGIVLPVDM